MMQNLNRKNSFDDFGAEPSPLVWEKIENRLPEPRDKKRRWLLWSAAAVFMAGILISSYLLDLEISLKRKGTAENSSTDNRDKTSSGIEKTTAEKNQLQVTENSKQDHTGAAKTPSSENVASSQASESSKEKNGILIAESPSKKTKQKVTVQKTPEENETILSGNTATSTMEISADERPYIYKVPSKSILMIPVSPDNTHQLLNPAYEETTMMKKKPSVSRWQILVAGGENYNYRVLDFTTTGNSTLSEVERNYLSENEKGIQTFAFETGVGYSLSTHFNLNFGINYFTAGQERNQSEIVFTSGNAGTPNTQYSVNTSAGVVTANGDQVDNAFFNTSDTSLFTAVTPLVGNPAPEDSSITQSFNLRQEFSFIGFPLLVQYQPVEHRFTPYIGLGLSAGYILSARVTVNDKELDYQYLKNANSIIVFAEAQAGVKYRINKHLFFKLQPSFRYGLNSLSGNENIKWIPYSAGIGAGMNFRF